ncbi:MAG TPA: bifunctional hydroxymethylpyrimidine kinase/phosphomethylpyrimidine kinase [Opitutaceae bacterium]|nr:bifunctional hydroxymethylpyrimidine kinase/phosphomethylpyrimidine kinase [Opitutaceae bacterium]
MLTIAGSDSGGGAGIQADSRTIHALGGFAATAITAITAQNTIGVQSWQPIAPKLVAAQIKSVIDDLPVAVIKTGLLPSAECIRTIVKALDSFANLRLVVDPLIGSTSGARFLDEKGVAALMKFLAPRAELLTPNWPEAAALSEREVASVADAELAARSILARCGCAAVLVKGGHGAGGLSEDILVERGGAALRLRRPRIRTANTHGTGCVLASAIATRLALGDELAAAVRFAGDFLHDALVAGRSQRFGAGHGPAFAGLRFKSPNR